MKPLLIASGNAGKLREIEQILSNPALHDQYQPWELLLPRQLGLALEVEEDGSTYAENAALKARAYCAASGMVTLADDSGLEVDVLGGQPGLRSARYAPWPNASDADRRRYLLQQLGVLPRPWKARFRCTVALAVPQGDLFSGEGACAGEIIVEERGSGGFGYDPIFYIPEWDKTMAELPAEIKNQISHRARAVQAVIPLLRKVLG